MNLNASIIDQQVRALSETLKSEFASRFNMKNDEAKVRSASFVFLVVKTFLDLSDEEVLDCITEGGNDLGVDALDVSSVQDGEFVVTVFQGKYKDRLDAGSEFPQSGVEKAIQAVGALFDPDYKITLNPALLKRVEEIRSLIRDGNIPSVHIVLCNNGRRWNSISQQLIDQSGFGAQVTWDHVDPDQLVKIMQATKPVDENLRLTGKAIVEDFDFRRVVIGKVAVSELAQLFSRHGDRLLERNIRRYLGLQGNRVNEAIQSTLRNQQEQSNFYFYNNGITVVCNQFQYNALQGENWQVRLSGLQVINGGQTCKTIEQVLSDGAVTTPKAFVLIRIYELPKGEEDLVRNITYATNSQNPVDLRDLRSNDDRQIRLQTSIQQLGYSYRRQRSEGPVKATEVTSAIAAESVLSVWRNRPHQAKFMSREHFGRLYDVIFSADLNGGQTVIATLLFRIAENKRKRPPEGMPEFLAYSSCFIAMLMGRSLLKDLGVGLSDLTHQNFEQAKALVESNGEEYFLQAIEAIKAALKSLYGDHPVSLQRLSATFRRGDLIEELGKI